MIDLKSYLAQIQVKNVNRLETVFMLTSMEMI